MIDFKPDKATLKSLRGQPLSVLLEYAASGKLPPKFSPEKEEKRIRAQAKVVHKTGLTVTEQILALRQDYDKIERALEW